MKAQLRMQAYFQWGPQKTKTKWLWMWSGDKQKGQWKQAYIRMMMHMKDT